MRTIWMLAIGGALCASPALAQTATTPEPKQPAEAQSQSPQANASSAGANAQQHILGDLKQAGFSQVRMLPEAFLVQAKDKSGDPVTMTITPTSVTELVATNGGSSAQPASGQSASDFATLQANDRMTSKIVGLNVADSGNKDIGTIKDIAYSGGRIRAYVVDVGGFLGIGSHEVAITPSAMQLSYDSQAKAWHAETNVTQAQLKAAPEFHDANKA